MDTRSNDETYRELRQRALEDLQDWSRRARSIAPVANPDDIRILRNIVRPAFEQAKLGSIGMTHAASGPLLPLLVKNAGMWDDFTGAAGRLWEGTKGVGNLLNPYQILKLPYEMGKGVYEAGQDIASGKTEGVLGGAGRVWEGLTSPLQERGGRLYDTTKNLVAGGAGIIPGVTPAARALGSQIGSENLGKADAAGRWVFRQLPETVALVGSGGLTSLPSLAGRAALWTGAGAGLEFGLPKLLEGGGAQTAQAAAPSGPGPMPDLNTPQGFAAALGQMARYRGRV